MEICNHKENCCGCTACVHVCPREAIRLTCDEEGFQYPSTDPQRCIGCGLCEQVCPVLRYDALEGMKPGPDVYAVRHKDASVMAHSSSGGAFTVLAQYVLSRSGVVCGCCYTEDMQVCHTFVQTYDELSLLRGSKYVQSDLRDCYVRIRQLLKEGRWVLFTGMPCQVEGLKGFLRKDYERLVTCDLLCYGVPSPQLFADYIAYVQQVTGKRVTDYRVRDKSLGWGRLLPRLDFADGSHIKGHEAWIWHRLYSRRMAFRPSCYACRFTSLCRPGDLSMGDFWGIEKSHPDFMDAKGVSLLLVNTAKGRAVFDAVCHDIQCLPCTTAECLQPCLQHPVAMPPKRVAFWQAYHHEGFRVLCARYGTDSLWQRIRSKLKRMTQKRK